MQGHKVSGYEIWVARCRDRIAHLAKTLSHGRPRSVSEYLGNEVHLIQFGGEEAWNNKSAGIRSLAASEPTGN